jgi:hypothetical protein
MERSLGEGVSEHHRDVLLCVLLVGFVLFELIYQVVGKLAHSACLDFRHVELLLSLVKDLFLAGV